MSRSFRALKPMSNKNHSVATRTNGEKKKLETNVLPNHGATESVNQESSGSIVGLPVESRIETLETHPTLSATAQDADPLSSVTPVALDGTSVESLLRHGCLQERPRHYLDLFTPLMEFFVYYYTRPNNVLTHARRMKSTPDSIDEVLRMETEGVIDSDISIPPRQNIAVNMNYTSAQDRTGVNDCNHWDNIQNKDVAMRCCYVETIEQSEKKYVAKEGSLDANASSLNSHSPQILSATPQQQRQLGSPNVNASCHGDYSNSTIQTLQDYKEQLKAQTQLMKVIVFPMTVFPYFASHPLEDISMQDAIKQSSCNLKDHRGVHWTPRKEEVEELSTRGKLINNVDVDPSTDNGRRSWLLVGEDFCRLSEHLKESCCSHYDFNKLDRLMQLLSGEAVSLYLQAFPDDNAYLMAKDATFVMEHWSRSASHGKFTTGLFTLAHRAGLNLFEQAVPCIQAITGIVQHHTRCRLALMSLRPRVQRVGLRLHLSAKEVEALTFLLLCHCGAMLCASINAPQTPLSMAHHMDLTPKALMWFLNEHRPHMKQGLLTPDARQRSSFVNSLVAMPQEVVTALTGDGLSEEQLIKLERTALAEVLDEERREQEEGRGGHRPKRPRQRREEEEKAGEGGEARRAPQRANGGPSPRREDDGDGPRGSSGGTESSSASEAGTDEDGDDVVDCSLQDMAPGMDAAFVPPRRDEVHGPGEESYASDCEGVPGESAPKSDGQCGGGGNGVQPVCVSGGDEEFSTSTNLSTYKTDFEYMEAAFDLIATFIRIRTAEGDIKDDEDCYQPKTKLEATLRELKGRQRVWMSVHKRRVQATLEQHAKGHGYLPRIEQLSQRLGLNELEKQVLLLMVGNVVSHDILIAINGRYGMRDGQRVLTVGYILFVLCEHLQERIAVRKSFYKSAPLISNNVLSLSLDTSCKSRFNTDLMDYVCDIDRKIVDYLMGTETETAEMVPGSRLYSPTVTIRNVVLPAQTTELVLSTIENYSLFEKCKVGCGFGKGLGSGASGLVILFYGPSGTGKTMLANAVAHELKRKILLVTVSEFRSDKNAAAMMNFIFREARLNDNAIIFFDECESLFETRESNPLVTSLLSDFEKYEGLVIMATNKAQNMDEAMNRRISLMIEFKLPGHEMREAIWRHHIPPGLKLHEGVKLNQLALNYELSGGLIRNAVLAALQHAVAREKTETPTLTMEDLEDGAKQQLRGFFLASQLPSAASSKFYVTPKCVLPELVVKDTTRKQIETIAKLAKSRSTLFSQWGFSQDACENIGAIYLFSGPSGAGKSLAAEGIAFECGATIRLCNLAELMLLQEVNIHTVFEEARSLGAIVVLDQAQSLFNHSERSISISQMIQYYAMRYPRPVIVIATTKASWDRDGGAMIGDSTSWIDVQASRLVFNMHVIFHLPSRELRKELWTKAFPAKVPLAKDVDFDVLSDSMVSGKMIRMVAFNVCCQVALLPEPRRKLEMKMILGELEAAMLRERGHNSSTIMFA